MKKSATERFEAREAKKRQDKLVLKAFRDAVEQLSKNVLQKPK